MTNEEIDQFKLEIYNTIIPHVMNMQEEKIVEIIKLVEKHVQLVILAYGVRHLPTPTSSAERGVIMSLCVLTKGFLPLDQLWIHGAC